MKIVLTTLHARYSHASLALPCLAAACHDLDGVESVIREYTVNEPPDGVLRRLVAEEADLVAFSCYIWNIEATLRLAADLKLLQPDTIIVFGGPEASHGVFALMEQHSAIDCVVRGEGEAIFRELVLRLRDGSTGNLTEEIAGLTWRADGEIVANPEREPLADLDSIPSPFLLGLADLTKPLVYCETSRGCPFSCAFCMSSLEKGVRSFSSERIRSDLAHLMAHGVQTIKLVDRTFNYDSARANDIWSFILEHNRTSRFHFEIAADLLTEANIALLTQVPAETFRFEIGVQSVNPATLARVGRTSDLERLFANVRRLREETAVTMHLDLVAGLPYEDFEGFLSSLDPLFDLSPRHIQVEPLKVMKGAPMRRIAVKEEYLFSPTPPYKILRTPWLTFREICRIELMGRLLDLVYNSGRFRTILAQLGAAGTLSRFFAELAEFWSSEAVPETLPQHELFVVIWRFCDTRMPEGEREKYRDALRYDFCLAENPAGKFPDFFFGEHTSPLPPLSKETLDSLMKEIIIPATGKVRTFSARFINDYRTRPIGGGPVDLFFVYISAPGQGLRVEVLAPRKASLQ